MLWMAVTAYISAQAAATITSPFSWRTVDCGPFACALTVEAMDEEWNCQPGLTVAACNKIRRYYLAE